MKHLLQDKRTRRYFANGRWTPDYSQAHNFGNALSAISFSISNKLKDVDMVLIMGNEPSAQHDIRLPLPCQ